MKKIQNIIVPTDFSVTARNSFRYAQHLARALDADLTVVHAQAHYLPSFDGAMIAMPPTDNHQADEQLAAFIMENEIHDAMNGAPRGVKRRLIDGDATSSLIELSEGADSDLIVIGATGLMDFITYMNGSTSLSVARKAHCPVLLIPREVEWQPIETILYAADEAALDDRMVAQVADLAVEIAAEIHFVHVSDTDPSIGNHATPFIWSDYLHVEKKALAYQTHTIFGDNKAAKLKAYVDTNGINMIAFVSRQRSFWEGLLHTSVIQAVVNESNVPILVQHFSDLAVVEKHEMAQVEML